MVIGPPQLNTQLTRTIRLIQMARLTDVTPQSTMFSIAMRGYDRAEVHEQLSRLDAEIRVTAADRDAIAAQANDLADQLDEARADIQALREEVDQLVTTPTSAADVSDRIARMLRLAADEAAETRADAQAEAAEIVSVAEQNANELETRQNREYEEWTQRRARLEAEQKETLARARTEAERIVEGAEAKRRQIEAETAAQQRQEQDDFNTTMAEKRTNALREIEELRDRARKDAERIVKEAQADADNRVRTASQQANDRISYASKLAEDLGAARDHLLSQIIKVREQFDSFPSLLNQTDEERDLLDDSARTTSANKREIASLQNNGRKNPEQAPRSSSESQHS
ncbi:hypothetical protein AS9A_3240 [Hoyosella subflava DQS3-9A1]|uniref:Cellulose-binding protein n=2 Tax=Hoyosella TaxID=697025 RepID=F6ENL6_HOYSD|nr:hypothetical protein AS9A_3240 [Hoyosella subflava DQS3-9A1]